MPDKLSSLKSYFRNVLEAGNSVCLWLSGGTDSLLLLEVLLETKLPFGILRFDDGWTREQKKYMDAVIMKHNLQVFSYPPVTSFLVTNGEDISLVTGYAVERGSAQALIVRDFVEDERRCSFDCGFEIAADAIPRIEFKIHVWGTRESDRHWTRGDGPLAETDWLVGGKLFVAPLWDWTRDEVIEALAGYGVEPPSIDTGDIAACTRCLTATEPVYCPKETREIPPVEWDRDGNMALLNKLLGQDPGSGVGEQDTDRSNPALEELHFD